MATGKKRSRSSATRTGSGRSAKSKAQAARIGGSFWRGAFQAITLTFFGRAFLALLGMAVLIGINLLFTGDKFELFYIVCAVEIIAFVAVGWLKLMLKPDDD